VIYVFGSLNVDFVSRVAAIPRPGETVLAREFFQAFGGKGANQAVAAARVSGPGTVAMIGAVGHDALGRSVLENLAGEGIDISAIASVSAETGCAFITVDDAGENAITVASGANLSASAAMLPDSAGLAAGDVFVLQMEVPVDENIAVAELAESRGAVVVLNLAPVPAKLDGDRLQRLLKAASVLVVNEHELHQVNALAGGEKDESLEHKAAALARAKRLAVVVTCGGDGAILVRPSGEKFQVAAAPVAVVDTTGAGDTFAGVLAAGLASGLDDLAAVERAVLAASLACEGLGAQSAMPSATQLYERLKT